MWLSLHGAFMMVLLALSATAGEFEDFLKPIFAQNCVSCHGKDKTKGKVNLFDIESVEQFTANADLIGKVLDALDSYDMPPEDEPQLSDSDHARALTSLKGLLREAIADEAIAESRVRRLNRFQYNNALRDLFALNKDVFHLPEKMMERHSNYLHQPRVRQAAKMPEKVSVSMRTENAKAGFADLRPFPKDLRALHGFDNQSNQLTMSPLLLDTFMKLSVSIVESPDFNPKHVGVWDEFFRPPAEDADTETELRNRLGPLLTQAFRSPVDADTINRYLAYAMTNFKEAASPPAPEPDAAPDAESSNEAVASPKPSAPISVGEPAFTVAMRKASSAILSSPLFLYRYTDGKPDDYELASRLSFVLWGSTPDKALLELAEKGELRKPELLEQTIERMLMDRKIERFLDTFPAQWMQLENLMAATPDRNKFRLYTIEPNAPASRQMAMEPLLLFDAVFVEDRPVIDLIAPDFGYRSDFLASWYDPDGLTPPQVDAGEAERINKENEAKRQELRDSIAKLKAEIEGITAPVRAKLLHLREQALGLGTQAPVDLEPYAVWEFNGDLKDSISGKALKAHGKHSFKDGKVELKKSYLQSENFPIEFKAKTLEAWIELPNAKQRGGGVIGFQGPGDFFDSIVLGEIEERHWISGSNGHSRTKPFPDSLPEQAPPKEAIHLVVTYAENGTTTMYRNGEPYGKPYQKGKATFPKDKTSAIFGLRHTPPGGNKHLHVLIDRARIYTRALSPEEVAAAFDNRGLYVPIKDVLAALSKEDRARRTELAKELRRQEVALGRVPKDINTKQAQDQANKAFTEAIKRQLRSRDYKRVTMDDPRYGGIITNAAALTMTSGPKHTKPISRGAWLIEVVFNDPPPPPPNDVPPLDENAGPKNQTIREKFAEHREQERCASCHQRIDPLGFALENFDPVGRWRDKYENKRDIDASGAMLKKYQFADVVDFKKAIVSEEARFAKAFTGHLLRYALERELGPADTLVIDDIVAKTKADNWRLGAILRAVLRSEAFLGQ
jgi:hypothetical protein